MVASTQKIKVKVKHLNYKLKTMKNKSVGFNQCATKLVISKRDICMHNLFMTFIVKIWINL